MSEFHDPHYRPPRPDLPYPGQPPVKKSHTVRNVVLAAAGGLVALVLVVSLALSTREGNKTSASTSSRSTHTVVYKITGTTKAASLITYTTDARGTTEQFSDAAVPWTKTFQIEKSFLPYQVIVQNDSGQYGTTVVCTILVDGVAVNTATGDGSSTIAHCIWSPR